MEFKGKVNIRELEKKTVEIKATASDAWVQKMLTASAPDSGVTGMSAVEWANNISEFNAELRVEKLGEDYLLSGHFKGQVPTGCSRCGDPIFALRQATFRVALVRTEKVKSLSQDELDSGDPDFVYFQGDEIDLNQLLREQLVVIEPVAECPPKDEVTGTCKLCGKNPVFSTSEGSFEKAAKLTGQGFENSAFSALSNLMKTRK